MIVQPFPIPVSANELGLIESNAFKVTTNVFAPDGDLLMQFDNSSPGYDRAPSKAYLYHDGSSQILPAGWYNLANVFAGAVSDAKLFNPAEGLVIRKAAGTPQLINWTAIPSY
jgi:uncharacterized protein (TIGR02597 family)